MDRRILGVLFILAFFFWIAAGVWTVCHARSGETPLYTVLARHGKFEVRDYPTLSLVSTPLDPVAAGGRMNGSFNRLAAFLNGGNSAGRKIARVAPVLIERGPGAGSSMAFILPRDVAASAPAPAVPGVSAETIPADRFAVLRYSGGRDRAAEDQALARLVALLPGYHWIANGEPRFAYYDPPWMPAWLRRNEVLIPVHAAEGR